MQACVPEKLSHDSSPLTGLTELQPFHLSGPRSVPLYVKSVQQNVLQGPSSHTVIRVPRGSSSLQEGRLVVNVCRWPGHKGVARPQMRRPFYLCGLGSPGPGLEARLCCPPFLGRPSSPSLSRYRWWRVTASELSCHPGLGSAQLGHPSSNNKSSPHWLTAGAAQ